MLPSEAERAASEVLRGFGADLLKQRVKHGISTRKMADQSNVDAETYVRLEEGTACISALGFKRIAAFLPPLRRWKGQLAEARKMSFEVTEVPPSAEQEEEEARRPVLRGRQPFSDALRAVRTDAGLSQTELGEMLDVVGQAVSAWESGEYTPIAAHYAQLRELFPELQHAQEPDCRDITKPVPGPRGSPRAPFSPLPPSPETPPPAPEPPPATPTQPSPPMLPPAPVPALPAVSVAPPRSSLALALQWMRVLGAVRSSPDYAVIRTLLETAAREGVGAAELLEGLDAS